MSSQRLLPMIVAAGFAAMTQAQTGAENGPFEVLHVRPNIYMLASSSGNVTLQVGDAPGQGLVLVDTGTAAMTNHILDEIRKITANRILYIVNTSADTHHVGGNETILARALPQGGVRQGPDVSPVSVFAQDNVLSRMSANGAGVPIGAWPSITFDIEKDFPSNGEPIQIIAEKAAHTDGDSIVFFRTSNVISTGDIFLTTGYPVIDLKRGGTIQGELKALNHIVDLAVPEIMQEGGTMVIPGQGRLCDQADVVEYRDMVTIIRDRVADMLKRGKTLEEVKAAKLSRDYDRRYSTSGWTGEMFVEAVYQSLQGAAR